MILFRRECDNHPLKPKYPEYKELTDAVVMILYPANVIELREKKELPEELNERQIKALEYIKEKGRINRSSYCEIFKISKTPAHRELQWLVSKKLIIKTGTGRSTHYIMK